MERKGGGSEVEMPETFTALTLLVAVVTFGSFPVPAKKIRLVIKMMATSVTSPEQQATSSIFPYLFQKGNMPS
jgi:hypothetical protein